MVDGWASAMLHLVVDSSDVKKQTEEGLKAADGTAAGKRVGQEYGKAFGGSSLGPIRDAHGRFITDSGKAGEQAGTAAGRGFASSFAKLTAGIATSFVKGFTGNLGGGGTSGTSGKGGKGITPAELAKKTAGGAGPGILGISALRASILGGGAVGVGALPALAAAGVVPGIAGAGLGAAASLFGQVSGPATALVQAQQKAQQAAAAATTPAQKKAAQAQAASVQQQAAGLDPAQRSMFNTISKLQDMWQKFTTSFAPLFAQAIAPVPRLFAQILPALQQFFRGAVTLIGPLLTGLGSLARQVLPLLGQAFRAVGPLMGPLLAGLTGLLTGLLPGLITLLHAAGPAVQVLAGFLASLGSGLGGLFAQFAPVVAASSIILRALLGVVTSLLPIVGSLAGTMARTLGPAFVAFAGVVRSLLPFLTLAGRLIASLAGAVLGDLSAALAAVAGLLHAVAPALTVFVRALGGVFTMLENTGVFAILGNALEAIAAPLGLLISALLRGLAPILPPLIGFISELAGIIVTILARALGALIPPLVQVANILLGALGRVLPPLAGALTQLANTVAKSLTTALVQLLPAVGQLAVSLVRILVALLPLVPPLVSLINLLVSLALKAIMPVIGIIAALGRVLALLVGWLANLITWVVDLATHWSDSWRAIQNAAGAAWRWIVGNVLSPMGTFFTRTIPGWVDFLTRRIQQFSRDFQTALNSGWQWVLINVIRPMGSFFTQTVPGFFTTAVTKIGQFWGNIQGAIRKPVAWVVDNVLNGIINVFDWITSHVGLGSPIKPIHPFGLAAGGRLPGYGGGDRRLAMLEDGETVVSKEHSLLPAMVQAFRGAGVPGYQSGGKVGQNPPPVNLHTGVSGTIGGPALGPLAGVIHKAADLAKITAALATGNTTALANAFADLAGARAPGLPGGTLLNILTAVPKTLIKDAVNWLIGAGGGASGSAIADYAMRFLGQIPYVWGGTAVPGGADCCLPGDQLVLTSCGPVPIARVAPGMMVATWDEGRPAFRQCVRRSAPRRQMTYRVSTATAKLEASGNHPFLTARPHGWTWTEVDDLRPGDLVCRYDEQAGDFRTEPVDTIEPLAEADTYDITVEGTHCFVAGGLVVHNSGFVQAIYEHFGIHAPRTSEAQGAWVRRSGPVAGGLAFYHSPPGGPDPGHVGLVRSATQVISQGGGLGPQLIPLHALPLLWTGVPPGGLGTAGPGGGLTGGTMTPSAISALWRAEGGPAWAALNMASIARAESGDRPGAIQQGQPPGLTGYGLYQITPTSGIVQGGVFGNLLNAANNTRAAISLFAQSGYGPWSSDPVGAGLLGAGARRGLARGGWINEPVTGVGRYSGVLYDIGESGREAVIPEADLAAAGGSMGALAGRLDRIAKLLESGPNRTAAGIAAANAGPARLAAHAAWIGAQ